MLLRGYRFEHPKTERSVVVHGLSYIWAGLFGAAYVRWVGYGSVLQAVAINLAFAVGTVLFLGITSYIAPLQQFLALVVGLPAIVVVQGMMMVSLIKTGFRRRGWMIRSHD
ncbi:hypothetical protein SAMN02745126_03353 [Enhydrobacter aerosaccus]|uniref:Uncharacterized protein n=1 Tax=Enhydrobacter aerosaccus TaxID=225324 RepID=A0A1T4QQD0_9HYPH|nr:hypothetical protein [Enhydrobacter aerosaccus]SKA05468.1 hypothetical protein SAMN02745126_03353 [Enhydrobacter aerosaccus]